MVSDRKSNTAPYSSLALATVCQPGVNGAQKVFRSDIKNTVQQWVTNQPNYGIRSEKQHRSLFFAGVGYCLPAGGERSAKSFPFRHKKYCSAVGNKPAKLWYRPARLQRVRFV